MYSLKISGTVVNPAPQTMQVAIQDIDAKATRDAQGLLHRDRVATKRKITLTFGALTVAAQRFWILLRPNSLVLNI